MEPLGKSRELTERKIIELIRECLDEMPGQYVPFGDDVSAVNLHDGTLAILKTDMLVGKTDAPKQMSLWQAARKTVVMNVSDLAAKGVQPLAVLASLGLPRGLSKKDILQIGMGLNSGAREYGAYVIGGDTNESSDLIINCMLFGVVERRYFVGRWNARPGDILAVTGNFGGPSAGLKILIEGLPSPSGIGERLVDSVLMPHARLREGLALSRAGVITASVDSSDGLAWSIHELSWASGVGFLLETLPISGEVKTFAELNRLDVKELCLYGGEEYELVVTVKPEAWNEAERVVREVGGSLIRVGVATEERKVRLRVGERELPVETRGWEHFRTLNS